MAPAPEPTTQLLISTESAKTYTPWALAPDSSKGHELHRVGCQEIWWVGLLHYPRVMA